MFNPMFYYSRHILLVGEVSLSLTAQKITWLRKMEKVTIPWIVLVLKPVKTLYKECNKRTLWNALSARKNFPFLNMRSCLSILRSVFNRWPEDLLPNNMSLQDWVLLTTDVTVCGNHGDGTVIDMFLILLDTAAIIYSLHIDTPRPGYTRIVQTVDNPNYIIRRGFDVLFGRRSCGGLPVQTGLKCLVERRTALPSAHPSAHNDIRLSDVFCLVMLLRYPCDVIGLLQNRSLVCCNGDFKLPLFDVFCLFNIICQQIFHEIPCR